MSSPLIVQVGKFGDCINILPFAYMMSKQLGQVEWLIGKQWASLLEGCSYVRPKIFDGTDDDLQGAIQENRGRPLWISQAWQNPDTTKQTSSFAKEQWRYLGVLEQRGKWPLIFDQRNPEREQRLIEKFIKKDSLNVLVGTTSVSTPYKHATRLLDELHQNLNANIVPLDSVKAERLYDLLGLYDATDLLISVDTCHLHLSRASYTPVIALVNDLPISGKSWWHGCVPPPQTVAAWGYNELGDRLNLVVDAAKSQLQKKAETLAVVIHSYDPTTDRHKRCMPTHPKDSIYLKPNPRYRMMKDYILEGMRRDKDVVVFTNDDVAFPEGSLEKIKAHASKFDFGCSRRPRTPTHIGREIFWYRTDWLKKNFDSLPTCYWGVQKPDLIMVRHLRRLKGIPTTLDNLNYDFAPVDVPAGIITHEDHPSHWANSEIEQSKEGLHNEGLWNS